MKETIETNKEEEIENNNDINKKSRKIDLIKYSRNLNNIEKDFKSENRLINIKNEIEIKESVQENLNEEKEETEMNERNNNPQENTKNFFSRIKDSINNAFKEVSLLWKSEELIDAYDANGNLVKRPKKKIALKKSQNEIDPIEEKISDNAKNETLNYAHDNISYGILFN